jgi:transcriptional regulator with XRE-family HTH domain
MERSKISQAALAGKLGVSEGRVSQVLNNPGNLTLKKIVEYARALGRKVSIVAYNDGDPDNRDGPVDAEIFATCWANAGKPTDHFALQGHEAAQHVRLSLLEYDRATSTADFLVSPTNPQMSQQTSGWYVVQKDSRGMEHSWLKQRR